MIPTNGRGAVNVTACYAHLLHVATWLFGNKVCSLMDSSLIA